MRTGQPREFIGVDVSGRCLDVRAVPGGIARIEGLIEQAVAAPPGGGTRAGLLAAVPGVQASGKGASPVTARAGPAVAPAAPA
jgi:hypothetical protein